MVTDMVQWSTNSAGTEKTLQISPLVVRNRQEMIRDVSAVRHLHCMSGRGWTLRSVVLDPHHSRALRHSILPVFARA